MGMLLPCPPKVEIDFIYSIDAQLTDFKGWSKLGQMAEQLGRSSEEAGEESDETTRPDPDGKPDEKPISDVDPS